MVVYEENQDRHCYLVVTYRLDQVLYSLVTNFTIFQVKSGECLRKPVNIWLCKQESKTDVFTLFCWSALVKFCTSLSPRFLRPRESVVNI